MSVSPSLIFHCLSHVYVGVQVSRTVGLPIRNLPLLLFSRIVVLSSFYSAVIER